VDDRPDGLPRHEPDRRERRLRRPVRARHDDPEHQQRCHQPDPRLARVKQTTVDEWRGITSTGITASYVAEATESTDNSPTLAQHGRRRSGRTRSCRSRSRSAWTGTSLQDDMTELFRDAKDVLESSKFVVRLRHERAVRRPDRHDHDGRRGGGPDGHAREPVRAQERSPAALPQQRAGRVPRERRHPRPVPPVRYRRLRRPRSGQDGLQAGTPSRLLGYPVYEASEISGTITNAVKMAVFGDFSRYMILDRVGLTVEVLPHLLGANRRPTGERGLYAYWRNGAKVLDANAFRARAPPDRGRFRMPVSPRLP
jgi:hypothetical protein